ncbi:F-box/LRR-repeat protein At1g67190 [Elaeis guineensis]|uniref:F-box/LRR-repeat protein At1g67190 n=1 Tax=Elaeis guineensis var. tenera TaxID=51953 RepID=A0A6I9QF20_ELAGV|nr:F-box/LRR-repeat protein At1g67190 [Elaeis guineensis]XP_010907591.1 F-box/LRR-repeat protein At1g67190 [Elaeis guineensis]XP_010907592.1 F-box/LRR-repeat protein At1g67190 [Elaeis guineensis]XP_019702478.1 F-box/LRR-repeat protein At1g67190 [Elaeis guineensis]XP_029117384.1 F-box/LRR-repeat protein At1g67190 [Elaeis guineensis]XP_029117385.1 F-box/LRR-repeat protein At1g67190 [Elaeis guineensis]
MENLPVEVIGNILSHLGTARDVVVASATCRKWREACRKHLHTLSFNSDDWPRDLPTRQLEILITQTIFQTMGLQCLSIHMDNAHEFSAAPVIAWLMYTRETLRSLSYNVRTTPNVNILEKCGRQKLEILDLDHNTITGVEPSYQRFTCLKSLSLRHVSISALDLSLLLAACPKIESLTLDTLEIVTSDSQSTMELSSQTLKSIYAKSIGVDKIILEADNLESLQLNALNLDLFELIGKGTLKHLKIDDVSVTHLDIGENTDHLEVVDVSNFTIVWPKFYHMISRSSKLRKLRLWGVVFDDEDEIVDSETIAVSFPQLRHLSLSYELRDGLLHYGLQGSSQLENVLILELGWTVISEHFGHWVCGMIEKCPNLKKLVIHGILSEAKTREERQMLANFTSFIVHLMRKYVDVDVQFEYE